METLAEDSVYKLSSSEDYQKTLIFVKLTDSALKSIEDYILQESKYFSKPIIKFNSNSGVLSLPNKTLHGFTLSNFETDGQQGSFECLHQSHSNSLDSLGSIFLKMHINATDESYENTRVKMAAVEKETKKLCTKVIKPSGPCIGRNVKVKRPIPSLKTLQSSQVKGPQKLPSPSRAQHHQSRNSFNVQNSELGSKGAKGTELPKQSCRDRIIHLLAVKPYKKAELLTKIQFAKMKDKERRGVGVILSQVAVLKENVYSLSNQVWSEVNDAWQLYTPEEAEIVRRKKYNILNNLEESEFDAEPSLSEKRELYEYDNESVEQHRKKKRISHYNRDENCSSNVSAHTEKMPLVSQKRNKLTELEFDNEQSKFRLLQKGDNEQNKFRQLQKGMPSTENGVHMKLNGESRKTKDYDKMDYDRSYTSEHLKVYDHLGVSNHESERIFNESCSRNDSAKNLENFSNSVGYTDAHNKIVTTYFNRVDKSLPKSDLRDAGKFHYATGSTLEVGHVPSSKQLIRNSNTISVNGNVETSENGLEKQIRGANVQSLGQCLPAEENNGEYNGNGLTGCPPYMRSYTTITSLEQRAQYKAQFNLEYERYRQLHERVTNYIQKFEGLEYRLSQCKPGSHELYDVQREIHNEYAEHNDCYQIEKRELENLHGKLSYIKQLVVEYDRSRKSALTSTATPEMT